MTMIIYNGKNRLGCELRCVGARSTGGIAIFIFATGRLAHLQRFRLFGTFLLDTWESPRSYRGHASRNFQKLVRQSHGFRARFLDLRLVGIRRLLPFYVRVCDVAVVTAQCRRDAITTN